MRALAGLAIVAAMVLPAQKQGLNMSGTWELVREKSSPRPPKLCNPNQRMAGLTDGRCLRAMPQLVIDEAPDHVSVMTDAVGLLSTSFPDKLELRDAFTPLGTIDREVTLAIRSTGAIVVRVFSPAPDAYRKPGLTFGSFDYPAESPGPLATGSNGWPFISPTPAGPARPGPALQCSELRFTLDRSDDLTIDGEGKCQSVRLHHVYRRLS